MPATVGGGPTPTGGPVLQVVFPASARSGHPEVDAFVAKFVNVCREGRYDDYCDMVDVVNQDPIPKSTFRRAYETVERVEIVRITEVVGFADPRFLAPAFRVVARVSFQEGRDRRPEAKEPVMLVYREPGGERWVMYRPTDSDMERLEAAVAAAAATRAAASQPASRPASP